MESTARAIVRRLREAGHEACYAGGCVRDMLLGKTPQDYDIATDARPEQVQALFPRTVPVGAQFGVILVVEQGVAARELECAVKGGGGAPHSNDGDRPATERAAGADDVAGARGALG